MQNDKIIQSWIPKKSNVKRWNQGKKINNAKESKKN
jgi:hypothetical protein